MNITDSNRLITADKLEAGMVIPGKVNGHAHTVTYVHTRKDSLLGTVVLVHTWNEVDEFSGVYDFRTFDKLWIKA